MKHTINLCKMQILLPENPTEVEISAADELQTHLEKMCGVKMPVAKENDVAGNVHCVYVGASAYAARHQVEYPDNRFGEGWAIKAVDGDLILCGGKVRGALYAVYHLLEDVFGVRWWTLWDEYIPAMFEAVVPADYSASGVPAMEYRDVFAWPVDTDSRFAVRNRLNGWALPIPKTLGGMETFGHPAHVHTFDRYFPEYGSDQGNVKEPFANALNPERESYFETHPEWYAISPRGKRIPKILCMSDEGLQQAFLTKLLKSIEFSYAEADAAGEPRPRYFDLSPADMRGECHCARCVESIRKHGSSGHQLRFVNKMAEEVKKVYPEAVIETISYWHYLVPPLDDTKPSEDVLLRYCNNKMDILHDIHHPNNRQYLEGLKKWISLCGKGNLYLWDYGVLYNPNGIVPSMYKLGTNFRTFADLGVNGYFLEMEHCITTDLWDIKVWMSSKLMEDPTLDQDELMDTFLNGYYGAAAPYIRRYMDATHALTEQFGACYDYCAASITHADGFDVEDILFYNSCFEDALAEVGNDPALLRRVRHARLGLDTVIVENYGKWLAQATKKQLQLPFDKMRVGRRIYHTLAEQVAFRGQWDPKATEVMKLYEKYLPEYANQEISADQAREAWLVKLHGCKDAWKGISPVIAPKEELEAVPRDNIYVFDVESDFSEWMEEDPESEIGFCASFDVAHLWKARMISPELLHNKWAVEADNDEKCIPIGVYTGVCDSNGWPITAVWGTIRASDIVADGQYHLYKFPDVVAVANGGKGVFHMFRDWAMAIHSLPLELNHLEGKKVDCYLSMKVTGDVTCNDPENLPAYGIDQIFIADKNAE